MAERPDKDAGFWCEYEAPKSHVSALVQRPAYQIDADTLSAAYMRDYRAGRGKAQGAA